MDRFTETTHTSYAQNIGNSLKGIFFGLLFIIGAIVLLWWNESNSVKQADALKQMEKELVLLPKALYDPAAEGKAVHVSGEVKPLSQVVDPLFNISADALQLKRHVQMYQWQEQTHTESKDKLGGGTETVTTYTYTKGWSGMHRNSSLFKHPEGHANPSMPYESQTFMTDAALGEFHLSKEMVGEIKATASLPLSNFPKTVGETKNYQSFLYMGENPQQPKVGDVKITYTYAPSGTYTYVAKEEGKNLVPYTSDNGRSLVLVHAGRVDASSMFKAEQERNRLFTWLWRGAGLLLMFIGFSMFMSIFETLAKVVPTLGYIVGYGTGIVATILTLILGSFIIALAWLGARPILSLGILAVGIVIAAVLGKVGKKKEGATVHSSASAQKQTSDAGHTVSTPPPRKGDTTPPPRK